LDCNAGSFQLERQDLDPVYTNTYFVIKDKAFVQPMAVVKWINPNEITVQGAKSVTFNIGLQNVYIALLDDKYNVVRLAKSDENGQVTINNIENATVNVAAIVTPEVVVPKGIAFAKLLIDYFNWYVDNNTVGEYCYPDSYSDNCTFTGDINIVSELNKWYKDKAIPKNALNEFIQSNATAWTKLLDLSQIDSDNITPDNLYEQLVQKLDENGDCLLYTSPSPRD
jgi:hypothetical protein